MNLAYPSASVINETGEKLNPPLFPSIKEITTVLPPIGLEFQSNNLTNTSSCDLAFVLMFST